MVEKTEAQTIADLATLANIKAPFFLCGPDERRFLATPGPNGSYTVGEYSDPHGLKLSKPRYVSQVVTLQRVDSLIEYVERFKTDSTILFADIETDTIRAMIDYHGDSNTFEPNKQAEHCAHRATLTLPCSLEWQTWSAADKKMVGQLPFARFIEENAPDIAAPAGADLLEVVKDLHANRKVNFIKAVRTASNNEDFEFTNETHLGTKKGSIEIPHEFLLKVPVYFGERLVELRAYLRWEIPENGGGLSLGLSLTRAEYVRQAMFQEIAMNVAEKTSCPLVYGKPEPK